MESYFPDTAEAVALELFKIIVDAESEQPPRVHNIPEATRLLDLFAECRNAVLGCRFGRPSLPLVN